MMMRLAWKSSAAVGSSARIISGSPASARANRTIRIEDGMIDESAPEMAVPVELMVQNKPRVFITCSSNGTTLLRSGYEAGSRLVLRQFLTPTRYLHGGTREAPMEVSAYYCAVVAEKPSMS